MRPSGTSTSTTGLVSANGKATYRASFSSVGVFASRFSTSDRKSTRLNSSHSQISYAVFCLKKKKAKPLEHRLQFGPAAVEPGSKPHALTPSRGRGLGGDFRMRALDIRLLGPLRGIARLFEA